MEAGTIKIRKYAWGKLLSDFLDQDSPLTISLFPKSKFRTFTFKKQTNSDNCYRCLQAVMAERVLTER